MLTFEEWRHTYADVFETDDAARAAWTAASNKGYSAGVQDTRELLAAHSAGAQEPVGYASPIALKGIVDGCRPWIGVSRTKGYVDDIPVFLHPQPMPQTHSAGAQANVHDQDNPATRAINRHILAYAASPPPMTDAAREAQAKHLEANFHDELKSFLSKRDQGKVMGMFRRAMAETAEIKRIDRAKGE